MVWTMRPHRASGLGHYLLYVVEQRQQDAHLKVLKQCSHWLPALRQSQALVYLIIFVVRAAM